MGRLHRILTFCLLLPAGAGTGLALELTLTPVVPRPSDEVFEQWKADYFDTDEMWRFKDWNEFEEVIRGGKLSPDLENMILGLRYAKFRQKKVNNLYLHYDMKTKGFGILVPKKIHERLPRSFIKRIQENHVAKKVKMPTLFNSPTLRELQSRLVKIGLSSEQRIAISREVIRLADGNFAVVLNPVSWSHLSDTFKQELLEANVEPRESTRGYNVKVKITQNDDLPSIASKYASGRDPRLVQSYLQGRLGSLDSVEIPIEELMPPFMRKHLNTYSPCNGPNCLNTSKNSNKPFTAKPDFSGEDETLNELYANSRFVSPEETLLPGDRLIYRKPDGEFVHITTYLGDDLVFTKNGFNKFNPYLTQTIHENENVYFFLEDFHMTALRPVGKNEKPIGMKAKEFRAANRKEVVYKKHEYKWLGFNPDTNLTERRRQLRQIERDWPYHDSELKKMLKDPRLTDMRVEIQSLISQRAKLQAIEPKLRRIEFNPFQPADQRAKSLEALLQKENIIAEEKEALEWVAKSYPTAHGEIIGRIETKFQTRIRPLGKSASCLIQLLEIFQ